MKHNNNNKDNGIICCFIKTQSLLFTKFSLPTKSIVCFDCVPNKAQLPLIFSLLTLNTIYKNHCTFCCV